MTETVLTEALRNAKTARAAFESARTLKSRREAAEDLEFWTNRTAFLTNAK